ncbi:carbon storage regulator [Legionella sp. CNM-4043-24]|uniref:carbon storage regulator n=1 Tax=Legionella sp. CNM-4043-24 TaxID=3421646 RepID=UPI00403A92EB
MLVLTRKQGEKVMINNGEIIIEILPRRSGSVRLGITAPAHVDVDRLEIFLKKKAERQLQETNGNAL